MNRRVLGRRWGWKLSENCIRSRDDEEQPCSSMSGKQTPAATRSVPRTTARHHSWARRRVLGSWHRRKWTVHRAHPPRRRVRARVDLACCTVSVEESKVRVESIRLKNFRAFKDVHMRDIPGFCVLIGANGTGKSTLFSVFAFLRDAMTTNVSAALGRLGGQQGISGSPFARRRRPYRDRAQDPGGHRWTQADTHHVFAHDQRGWCTAGGRARGPEVSARQRWATMALPGFSARRGRGGHQRDGLGGRRDSAPA